MKCTLLSKSAASGADNAYRGLEHLPIVRRLTFVRIGSSTPGFAIIKGMTVHVTEAELARDLHAVLEKVRQGMEVVIEQDNRPVAVLKAPQVKGRMISEVIADLKARGSNAVMDDDFARDVEEAIRAFREPWKPPAWE